MHAKHGSKILARHHSRLVTHGIQQNARKKSGVCGSSMCVEKEKLSVGFAVELQNPKAEAWLLWLGQSDTRHDHSATRTSRSPALPRLPEVSTARPASSLPISSFISAILMRAVPTLRNHFRTLAITGSDNTQRRPTMQLGTVQDTQSEGAA